MPKRKKTPRQDLSLDSVGITDHVPNAPHDQMHATQSVQEAAAWEGVENTLVLRQLKCHASLSINNHKNVQGAQK